MICLVIKFVMFTTVGDVRKSKQLSFIERK